MEDAECDEESTLPLALSLPRSRYAVPDLPPALPRASTPQTEEATSPAPRAPGARTRLEGLLEIILAEQRVQAENIGRLQVGIDQLSARLGPADAPPVPEQAAPTSSTSSLLTLATEVALLNALSDVLTRNHAVAQQRAADAAVRLELAESSLSLPTTSEQQPDVIVEQPIADALLYRDSRAEARRAAARDDEVVQRGRELLARTRVDDGEGAASVASQPARGDASLTLRGTSFASRLAANESLRSLLDYALSDSDFASVLAVLSAVGGSSGPPPANAAMRASLPDVLLRSAEQQETSCPVCLTDLGCSAKAMPCGSARVPHAFHSLCIDSWLRLHNSCPTCRAALAEPANCAAGAPDP